MNILFRKKGGGNKWNSCNTQSQNLNRGLSFITHTRGSTKWFINIYHKLHPKNTSSNDFLPIFYSMDPLLPETEQRSRYYRLWRQALSTQYSELLFRNEKDRKIELWDNTGTPYQRSLFSYPSVPMLHHTIN